MDIKIPKMPNLDRLHELRMNAHWPLFTPGNSRSSCHSLYTLIYLLHRNNKKNGKFNVYLPYLSYYSCPSLTKVHSILNNTT